MHRQFLWLATAILVVAAVLRLNGLTTYPPGPHYDEAANLLIARSVADGAGFFPIVEAYQGREVLYHYLAAPLLLAVHDGMFSLQLTSAFANLLTIAAGIALGRALFAGPRGLVIGLLIGVVMTLSFHHIWLARQGFRAVTLPLLQTLALLCLWRGLNARRLKARPLIIGGVFAGAALYTYMASRLFPVWLLIGGLLLLWLDRARWRRRIAQGALFFGALAITAAPMAIYALENPAIFLGRLGEVTQPETAVTLAESIGLHLRMFFIEGDPYLRYNIPGRPYFTPIEGALLIAGGLAAAYRLTRPAIPATERAAYGLALLAPLMTLPSVIAVGGLPPSHMRSLGMAPLIFVLVAVGAEAIYTGIVARLSQSAQIRRSQPLPGIAALTLIILIGGAVTVSATYFAWAGRADVFYETDADLAAAADWLPSARQPGDIVYIAARDRGHPTVQIADVGPVTWLGTDSLFRAPVDQQGLYVFPRSAPPPADWAGWLEAGRLNDLPQAPDARAAFAAFRVPGRADLPLSSPPPAPVRSEYLTLVGVVAPPISAGSSGEIVMHWRISAPPPFADLTPLVQLETPDGHRLSRAEPYLTETDRWRAGETLMQRARVTVPIGTPPGTYPLRAAWVARASETYAAFMADDRAGGIWATVGAVTVSRPDTFPDAAALTMDTRAPVDVAPGVRLLGWDAPPAAARPGAPLPLTLYWQATPHDGARASLRVTVALGAATLWQGSLPYPPARWIDGELVALPMRWALPRDQAAGEQPLSLTINEVRVMLGTVAVAGIARVTDPPPVDRRIDAVYADQIALYGCSLVAAGDDLTLTLIWQALAPIERDYTVFVHLVNGLDADGAILDQRDRMPVAGRYPTSLWQPGEYVRDVYRFVRPPTLDPQAYAFRVGWFWPPDGSRLARHDAPGDSLIIQTC
ncbi:MAG: hypothetical protein GYB67_16465 [Chloroflexi bacterium]|nr:hypothetical protein [Chloroflexota bacterium]